jgi:putative NADPH-quinone reductase
LDEDGFNPVMTKQDLKAFILGSRNTEKSHELLDPKVKEYKEKLLKANHLIFIFPIWWSLMPALTKGFIDKVIFPGIAYDFNESGTRMTNRMKDLKAVTMITTMNTPGIFYQAFLGNAIKKAVLLGTFWNIGIKKRKWISINMVKFVSQKRREKWLVSLEKRFAKLK